MRTPVASEDEPEAGTLYLEGTTAFGQPEGKRFPTPSGKLEFYSEAIEARRSSGEGLRSTQPRSSSRPATVSTTAMKSSLWRFPKEGSRQADR